MPGRRGATPPGGCGPHLVRPAEGGVPGLYKFLTRRLQKIGQRWGPRRVVFFVLFGFAGVVFSQFLDVKGKGWHRCLQKLEGVGPPVPARGTSVYQKK